MRHKKVLKGGIKGTCPPQLIKQGHISNLKNTSETAKFAIVQNRFYLNM